MKARQKNNVVNITCFQKAIPPFTEAIHSLIEKSFPNQKYIAKII